MKTPEEMAQQYISTIADTHSVKAACEKAFIAGYKAAQDQFADTSKVMPDSWDHILDATKMVDVNGWISVKDKSPEINQRVLFATNEKRLIVTGYRLSPAGKNEPWFHTDLGLWCGTETVTHWMPLPDMPKEEE
jgi:hypothetical protein